MEKFNFKTMSLFSIYLFNLAGKRLQDIFLKVKMMMKRMIVITGNDNGGNFRNGNGSLTANYRNSGYKDHTSKFIG